MVNDMIEDLKTWNHHDMWRGVVPQRLIRLLQDLGMRKREVNSTAREITNVLERTAMDLWLLTNAVRTRSEPVTDPAIPLHEKAERLSAAGMLGYSMRIFNYKHIEAKRKIVAKRHRDFHECEDIAILAPGQYVRDYVQQDNRIKQTMRRVAEVGKGTYRLSGAGACTSTL